MHTPVQSGRHRLSSTLAFNDLYTNNTASLHATLLFVDSSLRRATSASAMRMSLGVEGGLTCAEGLAPRRSRFARFAFALSVASSVATYRPSCQRAPNFPRMWPSNVP